MSSATLPSLSGSLLTLVLRREARVSLHPVDFVGAAGKDFPSIFRKTLMSTEYQPSVPAKPEAVPPPPAPSLSGDAALLPEISFLWIYPRIWPSIRSVLMPARGCMQPRELLSVLLMLFVRPSNLSRMWRPKLIRSDKPG